MNAIITLGRAGAISVFRKWKGTVCFSWPGLPERPTVDPTGAGDAFGAGFVASIVWASRTGRLPVGNEQDRNLALGTGSSFASRACQGYGGSGGCPRKGYLSSFVNDVSVLRLTDCRELGDTGEHLYSLDR